MNTEQSAVLHVTCACRQRAQTALTGGWGAHREGERAERVAVVADALLGRGSQQEADRRLEVAQRHVLYHPPLLRAAGVPALRSPQRPCLLLCHSAGSGRQGVLSPASNISQARMQAQGPRCMAALTIVLVDGRQPCYLEHLRALYVAPRHGLVPCHPLPRLCQLLCLSEQPTWGFSDRSAASFHARAREELSHCCTAVLHGHANVPDSGGHQPLHNL